MVAANGTGIGFQALNAHDVQLIDRPATLARARPPHGRICAAYSRLTGQDRRFRCGGFGGDLPVDARRRIAMAAKAIGVAIDMLDCGDPEPVARRKALCKSGGFRSFSSNPSRLFIPASALCNLLTQENPLAGQGRGAPWRRGACTGNLHRQRRAWGFGVTSGRVDGRAKAGRRPLGHQRGAAWARAGRGPLSPIRTPAGKAPAHRPRSPRPGCSAKAWSGPSRRGPSAADRPR